MYLSSYDTSTLYFDVVHQMHIVINKTECQLTTVVNVYIIPDVGTIKFNIIT